MGGIVNDRQTLDGSTFRTAVKHEIHGPDFVRGRRPYQRLTLACMPLMYAIRTLIGMKRKDLYPLLRVRLTDGTRVPVTRLVRA